MPRHPSSRLSKTQVQKRVFVFLSRILDQAKRKRLLSQDHFTVDGPLMEAWLRSRASSRKIPRMAHTYFFSLPAFNSPILASSDGFYWWEPTGYSYL